MPSSEAETVKSIGPSAAASFAMGETTTHPSSRIETPSTAGSTCQLTEAPTLSPAPSVIRAAKGSLIKFSSPLPGTVKAVLSGAVSLSSAGCASAKPATTLWSAVMPPIV